MLKKLFSVNETNGAVYDTGGKLSIWGDAKKGDEKVRLLSQTDLTEFFLLVDVFMR